MEGRIMFGGTDKNKLEFVWVDGKKHVINLRDSESDIDIEEVRKAYQKIIDDNTDKCKDIYFLGCGLLGSPQAASGFVIGWLFKSLKDSFEKKESDKWNIVHNEEDMSDDEFKSFITGSLRQLADKIETDDDYKIKKAPVIHAEPDGTELF